ncbi:hypothetical protein RvY_00248-1 [Ramazzottius varieornatus]|uniref:G-protein coupled receptors family 1 profile domain-containing protein n=1 Tax=Ramazzottius varieornatus TaxID=947166 RepID=A0A1D1UC38_RAMVA|nr:hypothetical protein RvY_00248-1 [Ramazzottius varieornatus]
MDNLVKLNLEGLQINNITKSMFSDPNSKLKFVQFGKFHYCNYAPHVQICTPKTDGISSRANLLDSQWLTIFSWIIGIVALVANLFVIGVRLFLWKGNNQMTKVHSLSIMNLAAADLVMGFYMFIISSADATYKADYSKHSYQWVHSHLCRFSGAISVVSFDSSALLLAYMAIERYIRLVYKPFAQKGLSLRTATECIVACWAFGLIAGILPLFAQLDVDGVQVFYGQNGVCLPLFIHEPFFKGWWMSTLIFIVVPSTAMLVVVCCYVSVFRHIEESRQATDRVSADKPHLKRVLTITISNLLCWVPIIILKAMAMAMFAIPGQVYSWMAVFILPLNCCINPIMYTLMTPECISAMKNCKWCNHTRNSSINSNSCCNTAFSVSTNGRVRSCASLTLRHAQSSATSISKTSASRMHSSRKPYKGLRRTSSLYAFRTNRSSRTSGTASYWLPPKSASTTCGNPQSTSDYESESLVHSPDGNTVPITTVSESVAIDMTAPGDVFKVGPFRWTLGD